jgi:MFS family permease
MLFLNEPVKEQRMMISSAKSIRGANSPGGPASGLAMPSLALSMVLASLGVSIPYVALPTLTEAFGVSFQAVQWIVIAYLLAITALVVGIGRLGDILGHRRVLLAGLGLFTAASIVCAAAPSFWCSLSDARCRVRELQR